MEVTRLGAQVVIVIEKTLQIIKTIDEDVDDLALALDAAPGDEVDAVAGGFSVLLVDLGADDEVGDARFIFERDEDDARCGGGALADKNDARRGDGFVSGPTGFVEEGCRGLDVVGVELFAEE